MATLPEKVLKNWSSKGKDEALSLFQKAYKHGASASVVGENQEFQRLVYDLVKQAVEGTLESEDVATFFTELSSTLGTGNAFSSLLADILTVLDAEVTCSESKEQRSAFKALTTACMELVGESLLKERLDMETLEMVGLVPSKTNFNQKYVKTKTKLFYKQQKFNLFREESEGYAKLVVELGHERRPDFAVPAMLNNIKSLIGRFNLDPNRALDMILEAFECHLDEHDFFLPLLKGYPCEPTTFVNILGFRFQCYQHQEVGKATPTPPSLYQLAAILLREKLVKLEELYPHLDLSDTVLKEFHESVLDDAKSKAKKANIVSLAEKTDEERDKEAEVAQEKREYRDKVLSLETNQKLGLCHAFLEIGDWVGAHSLIVLLPPFLPVWSPLIERSLCQLVQFSLEPLYRSYSPKAAKGSTLTPPSETVKQCSRFEDLYPDVFVMLYHVGPHVHTNPVLLAKIVRLGKVFMKERFGNSNGELRSQAKEDVFHGFISLLDEVVLPSLSLMPCNCGMAEETWSMIKQLPYQIRYQLYGHWKNRTYDLHPELMECRTQTLNRGRYIMKRLTKDNVKPSGRQIGKLSHSNPGIIFDYVLSQIQRYDNFILPVVDSLKYLIPLAYDVLAYCIIEALGNPQKERLKHDDTNVSNWLQGLASFCAHVFKKYPIELTGLLQYITNQLKAGKSFDLLVLKEVVQKMSGIEISEEITAPQLEALAGGELLKAEGAYFSQVRNTKKSSQRLREALIDANLSLPLCLLMAQQRECIIFREGAKRHLKLVGMLYDHCLDTLVQFGGFLSTHLSPEEYNKRIPPLLTLGQDYHIPSDLAFFLLRPGTSNAVSERFLELEKASKSESDKQDKPDKKSKSARQEAHYQLACQHVIDPVMENARLLQPQKVWEDISCKLFTTFWVHSLYDLYVPTSRYEEEVGKAKQAMQVLQDDQSLPSSKKKKEQERSTALIEKLQEERQRQEDNHRLVWEWLRQEKDAWFSARVTKNRTITQFLQLCIFPRCRFTASDAIYCAKFVYMLHSLQTPNFSTLLFFDRIFSDISYTVACCTENEVRRYGRFVGALLEIVSRWHASESAYAQECAKTPGFISMMRSSGSGNEKQYLDYENYRHITFKWHFKLTKSLVVLLESKDYMQVRNGLIILTKVLPYYPKVYHLSIALDKRIEKIMEEEKEKRQDLYALAIGYAGMLKNQKQNLVPEAEFHNREERVKHQQSDETKTTAAVKEKDVETPKEEKQTKSSSKPEEAKGAATPKVKLEESKSSSKEQVSASGGTKEEKRKEGGGKTEARASTPSEKGKSVSKERGSEKKGEGKESGALEQNEQAEQEVSSTAKPAATTKTVGSPLIHNGPVASSPTKAGQRRQHSGDSGSPDERDAKRRKLEDSSRASKEKDQPDHDSDKSLADKKEKTKVSEKKRERSSDKETPEPKRKRESPDATTPKDKESEGKEKKRVMKVSKKENSKTLSETSPTVAKKSVSVKKDKEDKKSHKVRVVKK